MTKNPPPHQTVRQILHPQSVAIVGASDSEEKWGGRLLRYMLRHRHDGPLYPINARAKELLGWKPEVTLIDGLHRYADWLSAQTA